jgi:hypothetical protein
MKLIGIILVLSVSFAASLVIDCTFTKGHVVYYYCELKSDPSIAERDMVVTSAYGEHKESMKHINVTSFMSLNSSYTINYMPRLNDLFPNLDRIVIQYNHLKEIRQTDLQPFSKLTHLFLAFNDIETIEPDLFMYNPQMEVIELQNNKITRVDPNVFDQLNQLLQLNVNNNTCVDGFTGYHAEVRTLTTKIKKQCNVVNLLPNENKQDKIDKTAIALKNGNTMTKKLHYVMNYSIALMVITSILNCQ